MIKNKSPDFDHWKQTSKQSIYLDRQTNKIYYAKSSGYDKDDDDWLGYATTYDIPDKKKEDNDGDCLGKGAAVDFFGQRIVFRLWGLKGEAYDFMAALIKDKWLVFSGKNYVFKFGAQLDKNLIIQAVRITIEHFDILENYSQLVECEKIIYR